MGEGQYEIETIVRQYLKPVFNFVYRLSGDRQEAADITQEVFVKVWRHLGQYDQSRNFKTWLFTIARRTTIDWLRKKHPLLFSQLEKFEGEEDFASSLVDEEPWPDELFERGELGEQLELALAQISFDQKTIIFLHLDQDLSFEEIAEALDRPMNTVKSLYRRGLLALRRILSSSAPK